LADRHDQSRFFRQANESLGWDHFLGRNLPANQGFGANHAAGYQIDARLVV